LRSLRHRVGDPDAGMSREAISAGLGLVAPQEN
jgi:hypothetical protein